MIMMRRMNEDAFLRFKASSLAAYARDLMQSNDLDPEQARNKAEAEFQAMLPDGPATKDHFLMTLQDADTGREVGWIWFLYEDGDAGRQVFLNDFLIFEEDRRKGYAASALHEMERQAKTDGCSTSVLYVWEHDVPASALYQKCGYEVLKSGDGGCYMKKDLNMKTLYVSDLDGTLLRSDERTSDFTNQTINALVAQGMLFSYATARSLITAKKVTKGLEAKIPLIIYNGAFVIDNETSEVLLANYFDTSVSDLLDRLFDEKIYPIVYAVIDGKEKFSFVPNLCTTGMTAFLDTRKGDIRTNPVSGLDELRKGRIFYITCIDAPEKLEPLFKTYKDRFHCVYQRDIYTGDQWLEIMPASASKANAVTQLKQLLNCDKVIAFGDGRNDIDLFEAADEGYAVSNAHEDLKAIASGIILSNNEDGVAHWLRENCDLDK